VLTAGRYSERPQSLINQLKTTAAYVSVG
jgi:hypothetical protein